MNKIMNPHQTATDKSTLPIVDILDFSHDGRGVAKVNGKTVFIEGALLGEKVSFAYTKRQSRYDTGHVMDVLEPSTSRVEPLCAHFAICGGCSLQHMSQQAQVEMKQSILLNHLKHFGKVEPQTVLPPLIGPAFSYRRKARLGVKFVTKKGKVIIGFREKSSHKLADLQRCEVLHPSVGTILPELQALITSLEAYEAIPQIEIAVGESVTAFIFRHLKPLNSSDEEKLVQFAQARKFALYGQSGGMDTVRLLWGPLDHKLHYTLPEFNIEIRFEPTDFTQVNWDINPVMVKTAIQLLDPASHETVLDLFCGLGNFTLPLARSARKVVGVEGSKSLVDRAGENARLNQIDNAEFYVADLEKDLFKSPGATWLHQKFDKILLDPPRTGAEAIIQALPKFEAQTIVYVSCNPATLARDVGVLVGQGYQLVSAGIMDMFPQTLHVESIVKLIKAK